jgi:hypothetical protein
VPARLATLGSGLAEDVPRESLGGPRRRDFAAVPDLVLRRRASL